ncbi:MAG: hypothetical protein HRU20_12265 [Pseudomonadales bacterium]|nr:hypothetical protein [Pseudomonadales bacterium]
MHYDVRFTTSKFDVLNEDRDHTNPVYGQSLLNWIKTLTDSPIDMADPEADDWGWYCDIQWRGLPYRLGSSATTLGDGEVQWILHIEKSRTLKESLLGKEKMTPSDACFMYFKEMITAESDFHHIEFL